MFNASTLATLDAARSALRAFDRAAAVLLLDDAAEATPERRPRNRLRRAAAIASNPIGSIGDALAILADPCLANRHADDAALDAAAERFLDLLAKIDANGAEILRDALADADADADAAETIADAARSCLWSILEGDDAAENSADAADAAAEREERLGALDVLDRAAYFSPESFAATLDDLAPFILRGEARPE
jgi:hypothetical protein